MALSTACGRGSGAWEPRCLGSVSCLGGGWGPVDWTEGCVGTQMPGFGPADGRGMGGRQGLGARMPGFYPQLSVTIAGTDCPWGWLPPLSLARGWWEHSLPDLGLRRVAVSLPPFICCLFFQTNWMRSWPQLSRPSAWARGLGLGGSPPLGRPGELRATSPLR